MGCGCASSQCGCKNVRVPDGPPGAQGPSNYDLWIAEGNVGTVADFLEAMGGTPGADGADGSTIFNGSGAPASGLGDAGDWYYDTGTAGQITVYYNNNGTWQQTTVIASGADGDPGDDATTPVITSGSGSPSSNPGATPTLYIDTATDTLYNWVVVSATWANLGSIKGDQGDPGDDGDDGYSPVFLSGNGSPSSGTGNDGDVYVDTTNAPFLNSLYTKSGGSWSLMTTFGGAQVLYGSGVPGSGLGNVGDTYINYADTSAPIFYKKTNATTWTSQFTLTGAGTTGYLFRASVGADQYLPNSTAVTKVNFGDDATTPNYDQGNTWVGFLWTANQDVTGIRFLLENLTIQRSTTGQAVTYAVRIIKRSGGSGTTLASGSIIFDTGEASDTAAIIDAGTFNVVAGDEVYVEVEANTAPTYTFRITDGTFYNQQ